MSRITVVIIFCCVAGLTAGCDQAGGQAMQPGHSVQFIAANRSTVLIDYARESASELDVARRVAAEKCAIFGGNRVVLESLNLRGGGQERATFVCQ